MIVRFCLNHAACYESCTHTLDETSVAVSQTDIAHASMAGTDFFLFQDHNLLPLLQHVARRCVRNYSARTHQRFRWKSQMQRPSSVIEAYSLVSFFMF